MPTHHDRVLVVGLDGLEPSLCDRYVAEGRMPNLNRLTGRAAVARLDHGVARNAGLAWEHFSSGRSPVDTGRWAAVHFDPRTYAVRQQPTALAPFAGSVDARVIVFDAPYFDMAKAPDVRGLVDWGIHDPGVMPMCNPPGLFAEVAERFGPYPAHEFIYGFTWPNADRTAAMGDKLAHGVDRRAEIAHWLLAERLPDWDLALVVVGEPHSVIEPMWHGVDADHPLHGIESAAASGEAVAGVYAAVDRLIGRLADAFPDAVCVMFAMHGMGPNTSDVPCMALLPELLYRHRFGRSLLEPRPQWRDAWPVGLAPHEDWDGAVRSRLLHDSSPGERWRAALRTLGARLRRRPVEAGLSEQSLDWMPAALYRRYWPDMPAFALPAFQNGRIRVNLEGRERDGMVAAADYGRVLEELKTLVAACRDARTGAKVATEFIRLCSDDPYSLNDTEADLEIVFEGCSAAWQHPELGTIGPLPFRGTGGHTGGHGIAWFAGRGIESRDLGARSSFDVVPTLFALMGQDPPAGVSGTPIPVRAGVEGFA